MELSGVSWSMGLHEEEDTTSKLPGNITHGKLALSLGWPSKSWSTRQRWPERWLMSSDRARLPPNDSGQS